MSGLFSEDSGFTLIEILIALTIVGIACMIIVQGYISLTGLVRQIREYQLVNSFANNKLIQLVQRTDLSTTGVEDLEIMEISWQSLDQSVGAGVRQVMIIVEWQGRRGLKEYKLTTLIEGGIYE